MIDPSIPLQVRPVVAPPNTSDQFLRALQLRQQQQEYGLQKTVAADTHALATQNLADKTRQVDVRNALAQAYKEGTVIDPSTGKATLDPDKFFASATRSGYGAEADAQRKADLESELKNHTTALDNEKKRIALLGNAAGSLASITDPDQQTQAIQDQLAQLVKAGALPPEMAQKIASIPPGPQRQTALIQFRDQAIEADKGVDQHAAALRAAQDKLKGEADIAKTQADTAKTNEELATTRRQAWATRLSGAKTAGQYSALLASAPKEIAAAFPDAAEFDPTTSPAEIRRLGMTPQEAETSIRENKKESDQATEVELAKKAALGKQPGATPEQVQEGQVADAALKRLDQSRVAGRPITQFVAPSNAPQAATISDVPEAIRGTVQRIINGDQAIPNLGRNNPTNQALTYWVGKVDPTYTAARVDLKKSFVSGKDADNVKSLNTVIGHLGALADNADKLDNSAFRKYNTFGNWLSREAGSDVTAPFRADRRGVASELSTALKGGLASEAEVKGWLDELDASGSPSSLKGTISEIGHILGSRMDALENKRANLPEDSRKTPLLTQKAKDTLDKLSPQSASGLIPTPSSQAEYDALKKGDKFKKPNDQKIYTKQ